MSDYHPWSIYIAAREEARRLGDRRIGTDHLLLGLLRDPQIETALHVSRADARAKLVELDNTALEAVGLPRMSGVPFIEERPIPPRPSARLVMANRIRMTPTAKSALQEAGKPMRRGKQITPQRVLLALLENQPPDPAATLLSALGVDAIALRARLESETETEDSS